MGLAVVHSIVKSYGGLITVESHLGHGSTFKVFLPRIEGEPNPEKTFPEETLPKGTERVLLVEDEEMQLQSAAWMLERLGYRVTARSSSLEALSDFDRSPYDFDLVITDQMMPRMTGLKLAEVFLKIRPDIPIIMCTGSSSLADGVTELNGIKARVMKPYNIRRMSEVIRIVLSPDV